MSNQQLINTKINNFRKAEERRVKQMISVSAETPVEKLKQIPVMMKEVISRADNVRFRRSHLVEIEKYKRTYELIYNVKSRRQAKYRTAQESVNLAILEKFEDEGIRILYPKTEFIQREVYRF